MCSDHQTFRPSHFLDLKPSTAFLRRPKHFGILHLFSNVIACKLLIFYLMLRIYLTIS